MLFGTKVSQTQNTTMRFVLLLYLFLLSQTSDAQIINGSDTLYGNEWIDFSKTYYKIKVASDGIYRVPYAAMQNAPEIASAPGSALRLYHNGEEVPLYITTDGLFGAGDFVEFYGKKNRGELDRHLFEDQETQQVNPEYSMFNDTSAYYLVRQPEGGAPLRIVGVANDLSNLPAKEEWCWYTAQDVKKGGYYKRNRASKVAFSIFDGDGWADGWGPTNNFQIPIRKIAPLQHTAKATVRFTGILPQNHVLDLLLNDSLLLTETYVGWKMVQPTINVPSAKLSPSTKITVRGTFNTTDVNLVSLIEIRYARLFDFENATSTTFELEANAASRYLEINAFNTTSGAPLLYDLSNRIRIQTNLDNGFVKAVLPSSNIVPKIELIAPSLINTVTNLQSRQFHDYSSDEDASYIILSNAVLFNDPENNGENWVQKYAEYRSSPEGGNYSVAIVEINELYEQFAWGQRFHPISVRNFTHYVNKNWADPKFLFIIGKGLDFSQLRTVTTAASYKDSLHLVPGYGYLGPDLPFVMTGGGITKPLMAVGRLAAIRPLEIKYYLDKVKEHEQQLNTAAQDIASRHWMKRIIHNSGGNNADEQQSFRSYTNGLKTIVETNRFGAEVSTFSKSSNDPLQLTGFEQMQILVNSGVSIWTIFGHSSVTFVDYDIGEAGTYNNKGKYPFMLVNGCYSGICSNTTKGIGENFVMAPERGAIAYCATVFNGFTGALYQYSEKYYNRMGGMDYGKTIGEQLKNTTSDLINEQNLDLRAAIHQFQLQGDPAVRLHSFSGPDYTLDANSVSFNPNPVSLDLDLLNFNVSVANIGENTGGNLVVRIEQQLPDNSIIPRILDTIPAPAFKKSLQYKVSVVGSQPGFNRFKLTVDPSNIVEEKPTAAEFNNSLLSSSGTEGVEVFFYSDEIEPLHPVEYGIVGQNKVTLSVTSLNTSASGKKVLFELDTLETFQSLWKKTFSTDQLPGLITWSPDVVLEDSAVYYWRVTKDTLLNNEYLWKTRSFVHLAGSEPGWNQSGFGQYINGLFSNILRDSINRQLDYSEDNSSISMQVAHRWGIGGIPTPGVYPGIQNAYYEGGYGDFFWGGVRFDVVVVVADQNTGRFVQLPPNSTYNPNPFQLFYTKFNTRDSIERIKLMTYIDDVVADDNYVGLMAFNIAFSSEQTIGYAPNIWAQDSISYGKNLFQVLEAQGAKEVRKLGTFNQNPPPYGFIFRKNDPTFSAIDTFVTGVDSVIYISRAFPAKWATGQFETPPIGPATHWQRLHWEHESFDAHNEQLRLHIYGIRTDATDTLLYKLDDQNVKSLSHLSATEFPFLKLRYEGQDSTLRTLPQPKYLRVLYSALPEGAMHPVAHEYFYADTLQQGDVMKASVAFRNVSDAPMDSLLVRFRIADNAGQSIANFPTTTLKSLPPGDTLHATFSYDTRLMNGPYQFSVFMNPDTAQPELRLDNNVYLRKFFVSLDNRNPLLDVTFDGLHILDGDLISPKPIINVSLKDDNPFLALSDTTAFRLRVQSPDGSIKPVYFSEVMFMPAEVSDLPNKNTAKLEWRPQFTQDGEYRLLVNGRDASGNASGSLDYAITFKVINKSSISNLLNYPNPFSTSTCFVYTMTGAETPVRFKIQIMSVSGKVVKEITEYEFGPLLPGTHRSDYCWNGRDNFGDQLANGVYLYRIVAKKADGSDFDFFENQSVDGYFKHGIGKMVLMR